MPKDDPLQEHEATTADIHANPAQLRFDLWSRIRQTAYRLASGDGGDPAELTQIIRDALIEVEPWERYFAFPGPAAVERIRLRLESKDYAALSAETERLDRLLSELGDGAASLAEALDFGGRTDDLIKVARLRLHFRFSFVTR
ncbi:MAG: hypothetical protein HQ526_01345, partial [Actinobacteria bacterium]|nr:hypothetical protein [Actinomycetota bacterium]